ncbi:hypothetical protein [Mucilaginibacter lappiensis]|uniref:Uncharacterized protein n=1 Tax=Mucilaginibacter lappiensis TaxID=354630 RepID=A0A841JB58_9SPHI|nr:hypothetical protein [Mucilaginibacter lappiensis]MBB6128343.1 hypothetical protein [Mucilaginibacter lappiensis]
MNIKSIINPYLLVFSAILISITTSSCNSLNRDNAKQALSNYLENQPDSKLSFKTTIDAVVRGQGERYNHEYKYLQPYIEAGLLKLKKREYRPNTEPIYWYVYTVTEKGRPFILKESDSGADYPLYRVKTYDLFVDEVTGMKFSSDNKQAVVDFTLSPKNVTPFGEASPDSKAKVLLSALFTLYDDGWRIETVDYTN